MNRPVRAKVKLLIRGFWVGAPGAPLTHSLSMFTFGTDILAWLLRGLDLLARRAGRRTLPSPWARSCLVVRVRERCGEPVRRLWWSQRWRGCWLRVMAGRRWQQRPGPGRGARGIDDALQPGGRDAHCALAPGSATAWASVPGRRAAVMSPSRWEQVIPAAPPDAGLDPLESEPAFQ